MFAHLSRLPVHYFEQRHLGDITSRFGSLGAIKNVLTEGAISAALDGIMLVATFALMLMYSAALTGIALAALGVYALLRAASYGAFRQASEERLVLAAKESSFFWKPSARLRRLSCLAARPSAWRAGKTWPLTCKTATCAPAKYLCGLVVLTRSFLG